MNTKRKVLAKISELEKAASIEDNADRRVALYIKIDELKELVGE